MARTVTLSESTPINGKEYQKGETISVSEGLYDHLKATDKIAPEKKATPKDEVK